MSFNVQFYSFAKEVNSSELPSGNGTVIPCDANDGVDIINPVISLQRGNGGVNSPTAWNYCKIPEFNNRFYFIENWEWRGGLWRAHCAIDVLATYRSQIMSMRAYVLRSAHSFDGTIPDGMYPARELFYYRTVSVNSLFPDDPFFGGCIVAGIVGSGATNYYAFTYGNFLVFVQRLLSNDYASDVVGKLQLDLYSEAKSIVDPLQYISSVNYIPLSRTTGDVESPLTLQVGYGEVEAVCAPIGSYERVTEVYQNITGIPTHPDDTRGEYLNHAPWSEYTLDIPPFGAIHIDADKFRGKIRCEYQVDWLTGATVLRIYGFDSNDNPTVEICCMKGQLGVPIEVGQVIARGKGILSWVNNVANIGSQIMGGITGGGGTGAMINNIAGTKATRRMGMGIGAVAGGVLSATSGISSAIIDAIQNKIPSANTVGSLGTYSDLKKNPTMYCQFIRPVEESNNTRGKPLCKEVVLSTLAADANNSGFMLIADPDIKNIAATADEREAIRGFMEGGFYLA